MSPCRFYNTPRGCNRGKQCSFRHEQSSSAPKTTASNTVSRAPPGICNFYWSTGTCKRGFDCRYEHRVNASIESRSGPSSDSTTAVEPLISKIPEFLAPGGLQKVSSSGTDIYFHDEGITLSPTETHNHLKRFLQDDFRFPNVLHVYSFLRLINNSKATNTTWNAEDGQLLLTTIANGNGLRRLDEIISWPSVSIRAGSSADTLSFQRGYLPLLRFYTSENVVKSTLSQSVNALYSKIVSNVQQFQATINDCVTRVVGSQTSTNSKNVIVSTLFVSLEVILFECLTRFKNAVLLYPALAALVTTLDDSFTSWTKAIELSSSSSQHSTDPLESAPKESRDHIISHLKGKIDRLVSIVEREKLAISRHDSTLSRQQIVHSTKGTSAMLYTIYEGPGNIRPLGPRHDNDSIDISDIRIAPTHEEIICAEAPFLPANIYDAPHPFPLDSMQRLLDIQFRLLREELISALRSSIQLVRNDLLAPVYKRTRLTDIIKAHGGKYRAQEGQESLIFNVYTDVKFLSIQADKRGLFVALSLDTPPGRARTSPAKVRSDFWKAGKRLMQGGLVALLWKVSDRANKDRVDVYLGTVASSSEELTASSKADDNRIVIRIAFFDATMDVRVLEALKREHGAGQMILVEASVMFESIRPFLEAIRVTPETVPFSEYIAHRPDGHLKNTIIHPPAYARTPGFYYQLSCLFPSETGVEDLKLFVDDGDSIQFAREELKRCSRLDFSQADAVVDSLTRELSLIQGPPGTGKSFTGVELLRVLLANAIKPVLLIAFTNHALDHLLTSILDAKITNKIVRLGSRSADERMQAFSLQNLEDIAGKSGHATFSGSNYWDLKNIEKQIATLVQNFTQPKVPSEKIRQYLELEYPEHSEHLLAPPYWVTAVFNDNAAQSDPDNQWKVAGKHGRSEVEDTSMYTFWKTAKDLDFVDEAHFEQEQLQQQRQNVVDSHSIPLPVPMNKYSVIQDSEAADASVSDSESEEEEDDDIMTEAWASEWFAAGLSESEEPSTPPIPAYFSGERRKEKARISSRPSSPVSEPVKVAYNPASFFTSYGLTGIPAKLTSQRPLPTLLSQGRMWTLSRQERVQLDSHWTACLREDMHANLMKEFEDLREKHVNARRLYQEGKDETQRQLLKDVDIVGCTTTGAAKLTSLLKGIGPRVMLVEEAGQVLEAHVLGSLVPSIEHLLLIGDPLQLRANLNTYSLSMDHPRGRKIYRFDMSLMERLANGGLEMSRIDVQRRMRPEISTLIRNTLYPTLQDHDLVKQYPPVKGFRKNVYFLSHNHRENGQDSEESSSKYNTYEVNMIKDLVVYLLKQGCYTDEGDIVVLCAYLGQLSRVRDAFSSIQVPVVLDDRDRIALADQEEDNAEDTSNANFSSPMVEHVQVSKRVRLRTVDNYQGEEASVVILSLVRNTGGDAALDRATIGFLKSDNRTNVALSRAKHGLYIMGNAEQLASKSRMWNSVIEILEDSNAIGSAFPVCCDRHPEEIKFISKPGELTEFAPDGGCLRACDARLSCGHMCPHKCHPDDEAHVGVRCIQQCTRLCSRGHPCNGLCAEKCRECQFPQKNIELPCKHISATVPCCHMDSLIDVRCMAVVEKSLPSCEHSVKLPCSDDPNTRKCMAPCGGILACCGRTCQLKCFQCQSVNVPVSSGPVSRSKHGAHSCQAILYCEHTCQEACSTDHQHTAFCKQACRQACSHTRCKNYCSTPCAPCQEPCTWNCAHYTCPVLCGSVCARLPCDIRCENNLPCGHRCTSVCGEDCSVQVCLICAPHDVKSQIVDLIMQTTIEDIDPNSDSLDSLLIRIPGCRHVFTVETLDGICGIKDYYSRQGEDGKWIGLQAPSTTGYQKPPVCPTCRTHIASPRYGRIFKRADLDILERNIAAHMSQSLAKVRAAIVSFSGRKQNVAAGLTKGADTIKAMVSGKGVKNRAKTLDRLLKNHQTVPIIPAALDPANTKCYHIASSVADNWMKLCRPLYQAYKEISRVSETRSAHTNAWESAFSYLYNQEMEEGLKNPRTAPRNPTEHAMRMAKIHIGQPKPLADKKYVVEAICMSLEIRFTLADLALAFLQAVSESAKMKDFGPGQRQEWAKFGLFILDSCIHDATNAHSIATASHARKQMTRTSLLIMRAKLERARFNVSIYRYSGLIKDHRDSLIDQVQDQCSEATATMQTTLVEHRRVQRRDRESEEKWLKENFKELAETILEEWDTLERSIRHDVWYEPVSLEEKMAIVASFKFSHTGHFYVCENGHPFVITECGGAMQQASCPECGAIIGGSGHTLNSSNARATELEGVARDQGALGNPWAWG